MTVFKKALQTLKDNPDIIKSIEENIQAPEMTNPTYKEEIISGYKVSYAYEKVKEKLKDGGDREIVSLYIYNIENLFTKESFYNNDKVYKDVMDSLQRKLSS